MGGGGGGGASLEPSYEFVNTCCGLRVSAREWGTELQAC